MSRVGRFWSSVKNVTPINRMKLHDVTDPMSYAGRKVMAARELGGPQEEITVKDIKGCVAPHLQKYFEINGTHLCHMYAFFIQMMEDRVPSEEEMSEFELASEVKDIKATHE